MKDIFIFFIFLSTTERRLTADRSNQISVRVIATVGITRGRKTVSPSRNQCDPDFSVRIFFKRTSIRSRSGKECDKDFSVRALALEHRCY